MKGERGAVTLVMIGVIGLVAVLGVGVASLALAYSARVEASTAADAAALAAAPATYPGTGRGSPVTQARAMAARNGALVVRCDCRVDAGLGVRTVTVRTRVDIDLPIFGHLGIHAAATAEFDPRRWLGR